MRAGLAAATIVIAGALALEHGALAATPDLLGSLPPAAPLEPSAGPFFSLSVPEYSSRPSARARVYLEFRGDTTDDWGGLNPGTTPAYDIDGQPGSFSQAELDNIHQIWQRVSEKYSPWDINVTTVDPGTYLHLETARIVIGGDGKNDGVNYWYGGTKPAGGIAFVEGFSNTDPNTGYVFSGNLGGGNPKYVAEASAHEAGHLFGLAHQSLYSGTTKLAEYNPGTGTGPGSKAPIMGRSYDAERGLWWNGKSLTFNTTQRDLDGIGNATNEFDFRVDDHAGTYDLATPLTITGNVSAIGSGVIEYMTDKDFFSFETAGGAIHLRVDPFSPGGMLDASLFLYDSNGLLMLSSITSNLFETIDTTLSAGHYELAVGSAGQYGDIGQYTVGAYVPEPSAILTIGIPLALLSRRRSRRV